MKAGDIFTDSRAQAWTLSSLLGEGVWGRTWSVRHDDGRQRVFKAPYEAEDLPPASADKVPLMRKSADEQADLLAAEIPGFVELEDRITLPSGATALLLPWFPTTLQRQLASGLPLTEALNILLAVSHKLQAFGRAHGNLRPSNILIDGQGAPVLCDVATPTAQTLMAHAERSRPMRRPWTPHDRIAPDGWSICQALHVAVLIDETSADDTAPLPTAGETGLDKIALAVLRDHAVARLKRDGANPRFVIRTAERLATLLARGLSKDADPSPPYRFLDAKALTPRLAEVVALTHPTVESVGKLLLSSSADGNVFSGEASVGFTVSVAPTEGVNDAGDIVCGVRLTDLDASGDGRVPLEDAQFTVDRHPSGRFRFEFNLPDVAPGRYAVRVAFSVRDSGQQPAVAEGRFEVRPPPGYVPPPVVDEGPAPIELAPLRPQTFEDDEEEEEAPTVLMQNVNFDFDTDPDDTGAEEGGAEIIDAFPRPLAPTSPGTAVERPPPPQPPPAPVAPRPVLAAVPTPAPTEPSEITSPSGIEPEPSAPASVTPAPVNPEPTPSVTMAAPVPAPTPPPVVTPASEPTPAPLPTDATWQASQQGEADFFGDGALPGGGGEDLMGEGKKAPSALNNLLEQLGPWVQRDSPYFPILVIAGCLIVIVVAMALMQLF